MNKLSPFKFNKNYYIPSTLSFGAAKIDNINSKFISIKESDYHPFIKQAMERLTKYNLEHGIIFTRDGKLIKETIGDNNKIYVSERVNEDLIKATTKTPRFILLHNHPNLDIYRKPKPITIQDAFYTALHGGSEVIAIHPDGTYSSVKCSPNKQKFNYDDADYIKGLLYQIQDDNLVELYNQSGKIRDDIWRDNAERLNIIYTNTYKY